MKKSKKITIKDKKGITLVALVITIIIIIILSTITLNAVFGDNGLINAAKQTKEDAEDFVNEENGKMDGLLDEYANIMAEDSNIANPIIVEISESHTTSTITINVETSSEEEMTYEYYINGELKATQSEPSYTVDVTLENKAPYIPSGFTHTEGTVDDGYVIQDTSVGNEFVWIPVKSGTYTAYVVAKGSDGSRGRSDEITIEISELTRVANNPDGGIREYTTWTEDEGDVNDKKSVAYFKHSVVENSGFYMGRYEMGMPGQKSGEAPTLEMTYEAQNVSGVPVCVARVIPWINIDWSTAKANLESMYNGEVQSAMMNSYARTTTINWLQDTGNDLSDSKQFGNYDSVNGGGVYFYFKGRYFVEGGIDVSNTSNYMNIGEAGEYVWRVLIETGADTQIEKRHALNNIYDLAGNAGEWSTERGINGSSHRISGGSYRNGSSRGIVDGNIALVSSGTTGNNETSSRPILYK